jgi:gamma-butyrobetaine dioxygenase
VTAVSYSPPFQVPLPRNTPHEFYVALARFAAVVFDNRRVLHGRTAFESRRFGSVSDRKDSGEPIRWLKGYYFEGDAMARHGRILRDRTARGEI